MAARHGKAEEPWSCCHVTSPSTPVAPLPALPQNFTAFHASLRSDVSVLRVPHERVSAPQRRWGAQGLACRAGGRTATRQRARPQARAPQPAAPALAQPRCRVAWAALRWRLPLSVRAR